MPKSSLFSANAGASSNKSYKSDLICEYISNNAVERTAFTWMTARKELQLPVLSLDTGPVLISKAGEEGASFFFNLLFGPQHLM